MLAAILDSNWEWWALTALAFIYGAVILTMIIVLVIKSGHTCYKKKERASKVE